MAKERYFIYNIKYSIEQSDINDYLQERDNPNLWGINYTEKDYQEAYEEILSTLPKILEIEIDSEDYEDDDDFIELLTNSISNETGWCVEDYNYYYIEEKAPEDDKYWENVVADYLNNLSDNEDYKDLKAILGKIGDFERNEVHTEIANHLMEDQELWDKICECIEYYFYHNKTIQKYNK